MTLTKGALVFFQLTPRGHSTTTWTKFYPILTFYPPSSRRLWTFYMLYYYLSYVHLTKHGLSKIYMTHVVFEYSVNISVSSVLENQRWWVLISKIFAMWNQVSRISFVFLKWRGMGPQKLAIIIGHKYSIFKPSKKIKLFF